MRIQHALSKTRAVVNVLASRARKRGVPLRWLFKTHSRLFRRFLREHRIEIERADGFTYVRLDGAPYVWPAEASVEPLLHLLAELNTPDHPHRYDVGATLLGANEVLLDVGCCEGGFAAKAAATGATIIAVEPSQVMAAVINRLFEVRDLPAPQIKQCLLGARSGLAYFRDNARDPAQSQIAGEEIQGSYPVPVRTLDELTAELSPKPSYIKCDAEGADLQILKGGRNYLREFRPKVAVTAYHHPSDFAEISDYLRSLGYVVEGKGLMYVAGEFRVVMIHAS